MKEIFSRRSIRKYESKPVPENLIKRILKAAMYAPTARNEQPWHFIVVRDRNVLDTIARLHPYAKMLKQAPLALVPCCDTGNFRSDGMFWIQDLSASIQNILLEAVHLGLGCCWCGVYPREELVEVMTKILHLPADVIPVAVIATGYPAEIKETPERFIPERIHYDKW